MNIGKLEYGCNGFRKGRRIDIKDYYILHLRAQCLKHLSKLLKAKFVMFTKLHGYSGSR